MGNYLYTIKSTSDDGVFYLVKDWRKNKAIWARKEKLKPEMLFKREQDAWASLTCLLKVMDEYSADTFEIAEFEYRKVLHISSK